jgi:hypothetical protein
MVFEKKKNKYYFIILFLLIKYYFIILFLFLFLFLLIFYYLSLLSNDILDVNIYQSILPPLLTTIPKDTLHIITGNMLGDGSIQYKKVLSNGKVIGNAKYGMTIDTYSLNYLNHLYETVYKSFSSSGLHPYPNILLPQHSNKAITQYSFNTRSLPIYSTLHSIWYSWSKEKKINL